MIVNDLFLDFDLVSTSVHFNIFTTKKNIALLAYVWSHCSTPKSVERDSVSAWYIVNIPFCAGPTVHVCPFFGTLDR